MLVNLRKAIVNPLILFGLILFLICFFVREQSGYFYYLTAAQLVFIPSILQIIFKLRRFEELILAAGMAAVAIINFNIPHSAALIGALIYLLVTFWVAWKGVDRFFKRGFSNTAELMIDVGLIYLAVGGMWFFAYIGKFDTGFGELTTWLTAIHFHYSAFMLCISVGLIGRVRMTKLYKMSALVIATGPMAVALGITVSHTIEIISVTLYVLAIYALSFYAFRLKFPLAQAISVRIPFVTLCATILGSFLYAYGNFSGNTVVTIPTMLSIHGFLNCLLFGSFTVIGWAMHTPATTQKPFSFPVSHIRGKLKESGVPHKGLIDQLEDYVKVRDLPVRIVDFYENTERFRLFASVKWAAWFKPLAFIYQFISRRMDQLNLPFSSSKMEMTGVILLVDEQLDGRIKPRVWKRMIGAETVFVAIYSSHQRDGRTYMNIALPLPFSSMHGILQLSAENERLHLTSNGHGDAGTYLALGSYIFKLPLNENFIIRESNGNLIATHDMTLFGLHFLHIDYDIEEKIHSSQF
ncbi:YndJ family protein [Planococcus shixiaomingii]|uniref:YndJ family protein n=1 Tax=Planococcus shixiaomingii TaxID=3058393 RepID=UPI002629B33F|nr:YndJ family protein [Planococcus sp. N022]WKA56573.1 YndJ family protein [Planococcus sp. N022]